MTINSTFARLDTGANNGKNCHWGVNDINTLLTAYGAAQRQVRRLSP